MASAGKYLLLDRFAVGGMAEIFRAKSMGIAGFEKIVAIKRILPALALDEGFVQMFVEEAKIAGRLRHANIVPILELGKMEDVHFIAMEYVSGKDLKQIFKELNLLGQRMTPPMAAWIAVQVLAGLDYAHRARGSDGRSLRLIHRDVSPQNLLLSFGGEVKVIDFGLAKAENRASQTQNGVVKGKLAYLSPEQAHGKRVDRRSDLFSLGICAWEMLTGKRAFKRVDDRETVLAIREGKVDRLSQHVEVPPALERIVMRALARDRRRRYRTALEIREDLDRYARTAGLRFGRSALRALMRKNFPERFAGEPVDAISLVNPKKRQRKRRQNRIESRPQFVPVDTISDTVDTLDVEAEFKLDDTTWDEGMATEPRLEPPAGDTQPNVIVPEEREP